MARLRQRCANGKRPLARPCADGLLPRQPSSLAQIGLRQRCANEIAPLAQLNRRPFGVINVESFAGFSADRIVVFGVVESPVLSHARTISRHWPSVFVGQWRATTGHAARSLAALSPEYRWPFGMPAAMSSRTALSVTGEMPAQVSGGVQGTTTCTVSPAG